MMILGELDNAFAEIKWLWKAQTPEDARDIVRIYAQLNAEMMERFLMDEAELEPLIGPSGRLEEGITHCRKSLSRWLESHPTSEFYRA